MGVIDVDPVKRLREAKARGFQLIVVDPCNTRTAQQADLFLQPFPGQDVPILAALLNVILAENWHDAQFCAAHVGAIGMDRLAGAVAPFLPEAVAVRTGLQPDQVRSVAELFARDGRKSIAFGFTGVNMGPQSNLAAHLLECLMVVCGGYFRAGESYRDYIPVAPFVQRRAEVIPPTRWKDQQYSRIRGISLCGERNSGTLADEILTSGEGQIRALVVIGGNLANSVPDQRRIVEALKSLELLVVVDPFLSNTARLAGHLLPPRMFYERDDVHLGLHGSTWYPIPMAQYTPALVPEPPNSELANECHVLWGLARRLGATINYGGYPLDMTASPASEEVFTRMLAGSVVSFAELKAAGGPLVADDGNGIEVLPPRPATVGTHFDLMPDDVVAELRETAAAKIIPGKWISNGETFSHLLAVRWRPFIYNTQGSSQPDHRGRTPYNAAFSHPDDIRKIRVMAGDLVTIRSDNGTIHAHVEVDEAVRPGVVSMSYGWGGLPEDDEGSGPRGASVNRLISDRRDVQVLNAMPRMTAIPLTIEAVRA